MGGMGRSRLAQCLSPQLWRSIFYSACWSVGLSTVIAGDATVSGVQCGSGTVVLSVLGGDTESCMADLGPFRVSWLNPLPFK